MNLDDKVVFVTGTNRGIGKAVVEALLKRKVKKVCRVFAKSLPVSNCLFILDKPMRYLI